MLNSSSTTKINSSSSSANYVSKSQQIQKELFRLKLQKKYPFLSKWRVLYFGFIDDKFESSIKVGNCDLKFELELSDQILDSTALCDGGDDNSQTGLTSIGKFSQRRGDGDDIHRRHRRLRFPQNRHHYWSFSSASSSGGEQQEEGVASATAEVVDDLEIDFLSEPPSDDDETYSILEDEFILRGDVIWDEETKSNACVKYDEFISPILECKLFEYDVRLRTLKFNGPNVKLAFDVSYESEDKSTDTSHAMTLRNIQDKIFIGCVKTLSSDNYDKSYDFSSMFNNEFLADYKIKSSTGQIFHVHKSIIWLTLKEKTDLFLQKLSKCNLDSGSLELVLFYCYSDCLPTRLDLKPSCTQSANSQDGASGGEVVLSFGDEARLTSLMQFLNEYEELSNLNELLKIYMNNFSFKLKTDRLINEIKNCFESINVHFKYDENNVIYQQLFLNPSKLCQVIKVSFEQLYLGFLKIIRLLDMYSQKQEQLSKDEKSDFIKKVKNSLPFFLSQLEKFLNSIYKHSLQMTDANKREMAEYMIPEIDVFVKNSLELIRSSESVIERIVNAKKSNENESVTAASSKLSSCPARPANEESGDDGASSSASSDDLSVLQSNKPASKSLSTAATKLTSNSKKLKTKLGRTIKNAMHLRELKKIQKFKEKIDESFIRIEEIFDKYENTNQDAKVNLVHKELSSFIDNIVHDIPRVLRKLKDYSKDQNMLLNKALKIYDFKFAFKLFASKTEWFLSELKSNRQIVDPYIANVCMKLQNGEFNKELEKLSLAPLSSSPSPSNHPSNDASSLGFSSVNQVQTKSYLDSLFKSKSAESNRLALQACELYKCQNFTDLCIEVHDTNNDNIIQVRVHACIIASRCEWFKLALSSGMRESIDRRIVLHEDKPSDLFCHFIGYLYSGQLSDIVNSTDELIDLLTIADKYECDSLKDMVEKKLILFIRNQYDIALKPQQQTDSEAPSNEQNSSSFLLVLIDYLNLSDRYKLDVLLALSVSILVEHVDNLNSKSDTAATPIELDSIEEFKQLSVDLQSLIKDKHAQHIQMKEMLKEQQKRRHERQLLRLGISEGRRARGMTQNGLAASTLIFYDDEDDDDDYNLDDADDDEGGDSTRGRSLIPGAPAHTPTHDYLSSSSLSLNGGGVGLAGGIVRQPPFSRLDELVTLAHPLIVLDGILLENAFNQLKEIIADANISDSSDEHLVKLLIRHDCDLNRVIPIVLNLE